MKPSNTILIQNVHLSSSLDRIEDLSARIVNKLKDNGLLTIGDLLSFVIDENAKINGIGKKSLAELVNALVKFSEVNDKYITLSTLKSRNWTDSLIKKFLGEPDRYATNPNYKSAPPMKLYSISHVEHVERQQEFQKLIQSKQASRDKLKAAQIKIADGKRTKLLAYINSLKIQIDHYNSNKELFACAVNHYNWLWAERGRIEKHASVFDDIDFLCRISVNMLRHNSDKYEEELFGLFGQVGKDKGYAALKNKVLIEIAKKYPILSGECSLQML